MLEAERELYKLGVPVKTRHNEVAPSQYEIAPIFENANVATDHQMLAMEMLRRVAPKYGLACLLHEKPFAGVNGSGKHLNWSMCDDLGQQPAQPRRHAARQRPVPRLLRRRHPRRRQVPGAAARQRSPAPATTTASAPTKRRRRSSRSSSATCSDIVEQIEKGAAPRRTKAGGIMEIGVAVLPKLPRDAGDRNRTSPFAFTGNKFEFRAVASSQSIARPNVVLNTTSPSRSTTSRPSSRRRSKGGKKLASRDPDAAAQADQGEQEDHLQRRRLHRGVAQGGREARPAEPARPRSTPAAKRSSPTSIKAFGKYGVLTERELHARYEIVLENYNKTINIEAQLTVLMANRHILPAALRYQGEVAQTVSAVKAAGGDAPRRRARALDEITRLIDECRRHASTRCRSCSSTRRTATPTSTPSTSATRWCRR